MSGRILDIDGSEYNGVWQMWKFGSLGLFAVFVALLADVARTMRRIEQNRGRGEGAFIGVVDEYMTIWSSEPGASKRIGDLVQRADEETHEIWLTGSAA